MTQEMPPIEDIRPGDVFITRGGVEVTLKFVTQSVPELHGDGSAGGDDWPEVWDASGRADLREGYRSCSDLSHRIRRAGEA